MPFTHGALLKNNNIQGFQWAPTTNEHVSYFAHRSRLPFSRRKTELIWITLSTKNIIIVIKNMNENVLWSCVFIKAHWFYVMLESCKCCSSVNFYRFLYRFTQNLFTWKSTQLVFIILFIACRNWLWLIDQKFKESDTDFLEWRTRSFVDPQFSPQNAENHILGLSIFKIFLPSGANMPVLIQSVTLFNSTG